MKHPPMTTVMLIILFLAAQFTGLAIIAQYVDIQQSAQAGKTVQRTDVYERVGVEPPQVANESFTFIYILIAVLVGTVFLLLIVKFKKRRIWKVWYFIAVFYALLIAFNALLEYIIPQSQLFAPYIAFAAAIGFAAIKIFRPNIIIHNITEVLMYGGIAALVVPVVNVISATILLILISAYDAYAVWKSKHMVAMAKFQSSEGVFAGLTIPYHLEIRPAKPASAPHPPNLDSQSPNTAILGGGDIAFPLVFAGALMKATGSPIRPIVVILVTTIALALLFVYGKKGRFYPAMPFITAGCFAGYLISLVII
jgi:presenilin-like A22 family membrane protease